LGLGLKKNDKICILSKNRPEWCILCLASMCIGCIPVGIYQSSSSSDVNFILENSEAKLICIEDKKQYLKLNTSNMKNLNKIILDEDEEINQENFISWKNFTTLKTNITDLVVDELISSISLDDPAVIIYTVTGGGPPKGVILSHRNISFATLACKTIGSLSNKSVFLSYLPLAHIAEQIFSIQF
jgi:long-chain acyl-CoA synthetase